MVNHFFEREKLMNIFNKVVIAAVFVANVSFGWCVDDAAVDEFRATRGRMDTSAMREFIGRNETIRGDVLNEICEITYGTALNFACSEGDRNLVDLLLERGADLNLMAVYSPLMVAAFHDHQCVVEWLAHSGSAINTENQEGWTALSASCQTLHKKEWSAVTGILLMYGADLYHVDHHGRTPLSYLTPAMQADYTAQYPRQN